MSVTSEHSESPKKKKSPKKTLSKKKRSKKIIHNEKNIDEVNEHVFVTKELSEEEDGAIDEIQEKKQDTLSQNMSEADEKNIDDRLVEIYENGDGSMPNMHQFERRKRNKTARAFGVLVFSFLLFAVVAWVGFFVIQPRAQFSQEDIVLTITGDEEVSAGDDVTYRIRYRNAQHVALDNARLEIRYPKGFVFVTSTVPSTNETHDMWNIGTIDPNGGSYIDITGTLFGNVDEDQSFRVFLDYVPTNFTSQFQQVSFVSVKTIQDTADIVIDMASEVASGDTTPISVNIIPRAGTTLKNIRVECEGEGFVPQEVSQPDMDSASSCGWVFDEIIEPVHISFSGAFVGEGDKLLSVSLRGWSDEQKNGEGYILSRTEVPVHLVETATTVNVAVNGSVGDMQIKPGENMSTSIIVKNNGEAVMHDVVVNLSFDAPSYQNKSILDWSKIDLSDDADIFGKQIDDTVRAGLLSWDGRYISDLVSLNPGEEVHIDVTLPIKGGSATTLTNYENNHIYIHGDVSYTLAGEEKTQQLNDITLTLVSDTRVDVQDSIQQDVEGNDVHTVTWLLSNSYHDVSSIVLEADIYGDVLLNKENFVVPAGELVYDPDTKHMTWRIDSMPTSVDVFAAQFDIVVRTSNPSQTQLVSVVKGKAQDSILNTALYFVGDAIGLEYSE